MFWWKDKFIIYLARYYTAVLGMFFILCTAGCGFVDLRPVGYSSFPGEANTVLSSRNAAVGIRFDTAMDREETQKAFSVSCNGMQVSGDLSWNDNELLFIPPEGWQAGLRYMLVLDGTVFARDGRDARAALYVPFFAVSAELPCLLDFTPADGASVGINPGEGAMLVLRFSVSMDRFSTEDALVIDGSGEREFRWSNEDKTLEILPKKNLAPWTVYRWTLSGKARSREGAPLVKAVSASFITDIDRTLPDITEVCPLIRRGADAGLWWQRMDLSLENGLGSGQAIGVCFNKAVDDSALRAIRFTPALAGRCERWTDSSIVFIPDRDPEPETAYTLIVSAETKDISGLKMEKERRFYFTLDIPYLTPLSLCAGGEYLDNPENNAVLAARVIEPDGLLTVTIRFSHIFEPDAKISAVRLLRLEPYFPRIISPASLTFVEWKADTMTLQWEGAMPDKNGMPRYYRLVLPGGRGGISDGKGSYLKEDLNFIVEVIK